MATKPPVHSIDELEEYATNNLPKTARDYFNGGSLDSITLRANRQEYQKYYIRPRVLRDVSNVQTSLKVFPGGNDLPFPCAVAPAAMQRMAHPDGEIATARGCGMFGCPMGLSTFATTSLEDTKTAADQARKAAGRNDTSECILQMYLFENRETSRALIERAERAGYKAIVLTVDTPFFGRRLTEIRNGFRLPPHLRLANFDESLGVKTGSEHRTEAVEAGRQLAPQGKTAAAPTNKLDASLTWESVKYLRSVTKLPVWLKGIMTPEDAILAVEHGADAIFVSNHGGRQLDGSPPSLRVLESIARVVDKRVPVHFDGGVRRGSDIFKALCLGADMVWIGRPALWAIAYDGEKGLINALSVLQDEFRQCMGLAGCTSLSELGPDKLMAVDAKL